MVCMHGTGYGDVGNISVAWHSSDQLRSSDYQGDYAIEIWKNENA